MYVKLVALKVFTKQVTCWQVITRSSSDVRQGTQEMPEQEDVSSQGTLTREHVSTQKTLTCKHARHVSA